MRPIILVSLALVLASCSKSTTPQAAHPTNDPVPMTEPAAQAAQPDAPAVNTLAAYERARALLAADELKGLPEAARELETAAKAVASSSGAHYASIASSAATLAAASDLKAARTAFGEVSRHIVALIASDKTLATGHHVFECPMVAGYNKWVQPSENLQNPYMGKRMLTCGGESTWQ